LRSQHGLKFVAWGDALEALHSPQPRIIALTFDVQKRNVDSEGAA
jgi:hypothetical protein